MKFTSLILIILFTLCGCTTASTTDSTANAKSAGWQVDFFDDFDSFNTENWQDQMIWVNDENHCYVPDNQFNTREVSDGTLKVRVVDLGEKRPCDNLDKTGKKHPDTQYVAGRIASKNRKEFIKGKWTARLKVETVAKPGCSPHGGCWAP